jgi:hypothetical protein
VFAIRAHSADDEVASSVAFGGDQIVTSFAMHPHGSTGAYDVRAKGFTITA